MLAHFRGHAFSRDLKLRRGLGLLAKFAPDDRLFPFPRREETVVVKLSAAADLEQFLGAKIIPLLEREIDTRGQDIVRVRRFSYRLTFDGVVPPTQIGFPKEIDVCAKKCETEVDRFPSKRVIQSFSGIGVTQENPIGYGQFGDDGEIARIQREILLEAMSRIAPIALAAIDHCRKKQNTSVVRQTAPGLSELGEGSSVIARSPVMKHRTNEMHLRVVGPQPFRLSDVLLGQPNMVDSLVRVHPMEVKVILREQTDCL